MNGQIWRRKIVIGLTAVVLAVLVAGPAAAQQRISLQELSRYLDAIGTLQAEFTQINADGTISTGVVRISRPGRIRFEYAPPDRSLVVSDGNQVAIFDARSNTLPERYPVRRTPLNLILAPNIDLTRARMVVAHRADGPRTHVVAQDPDNPQYGSIELVFTPNPTELRQWIITDDVGQKTTVIMGEARKGAAISSTLFSIERELRNRGLETDN